MKIAHFFLFACCLTLAVAGCSGKEDNTLASENATADDFAEYESKFGRS